MSLVPPRLRPSLLARGKVRRRIFATGAVIATAAFMGPIALSTKSGAAPGDTTTTIVVDGSTTSTTGTSSTTIYASTTSTTTTTEPATTPTTDTPVTGEGIVAIGSGGATIIAD